MSEKLDEFKLLNALCRGCEMFSATIFAGLPCMSAFTRGVDLKKSGLAGPMTGGAVFRRRFIKQDRLSVYEAMTCVASFATNALVSPRQRKRGTSLVVE